MKELTEAHAPFATRLVNRQQLDVIDFLCEENRVLREQLGGRRLRLTDAPRRRLAVKGKAIGRKLLKEVACIVTPDTILGWTASSSRESMTVAGAEVRGVLARPNYHGERHHQGFGHWLLKPHETAGRDAGPVACRERVGGMLGHYYREAA